MDVHNQIPIKEKAFMFVSSGTLMFRQFSRVYSLSQLGMIMESNDNIPLSPICQDVEIRLLSYLIHHLSRFKNHVIILSSSIIGIHIIKLSLLHFDSAHPLLFMYIHRLAMRSLMRLLSVHRYRDNLPLGEGDKDNSGRSAL